GIDVHESVANRDTFAARGLVAMHDDADSRCEFLIPYYPKFVFIKVDKEVRVFAEIPCVIVLVESPRPYAKLQILALILARLLHGPQYRIVPAAVRILQYLAERTRGYFPLLEIIVSQLKDKYFFKRHGEEEDGEATHIQTPCKPSLTAAVARLSVSRL